MCMGLLWKIYIIRINVKFRDLGIENMRDDCRKKVMRRNGINIGGKFGIGNL